MGVISNLLKNWEKRKLESVLEKNPRPPAEVFLKLAAIYQAEGDFAAASRIAKKGQSLYPRNLEISRASKNMEKVVRELEKERLRQKIESYPNPILYARLAELYKADNQIDAAEKVCQAGIRAFPEYGGTYLLLGQICYERGDFDGALGYLEKATELDKYNYMALRLLADTYIQMGRPAEAAEKLEQILYFAPGDEQITEALAAARQAANARKQAPAKAKAVSATTVVEPPPKPKPQTLPSAAASSKRSPKAETKIHAGQSSGPGLSEASLTKAIEIFKNLSGVRGALLVDSYGLVVASHLPGDMDEELAGAMITNIYRSTARSAEKMGLGTFEDGLVEGRDGNIHIVAVADMILAVFAEASIKMGLLEKSIRDFAAIVLEMG